MVQWLTMAIWPWVKVKKHPWDIDNNCVNYNPRCQWKIMHRHEFLLPVHCDLDLKDITLEQGHDTPLGRELNHVKYIQISSENLWPGHKFWLHVHCDPDLYDMTLSQGHDTSLAQRQQLCEILSRSDIAVRSYGQTTDFCFVWPRPWRYDLKWRSLHTLGSRITIVWQVIQQGIRSYGPNKIWADRLTHKVNPIVLYRFESLSGHVLITELGVQISVAASAAVLIYLWLFYFESGKLWVYGCYKIILPSTYW